MKREYRIVRDDYDGYEFQWRQWWMPFWRRRGNTSKTVEQAEEKARKHAEYVVKHLGNLP